MTPPAKLDGNHHFTGVTADVVANVDFWCGVLGLRFVKKTLNFETTFRYHTYFGDETGAPGSVVTFLEQKGLPRGIAGAGNIQSLILRVASDEAIDFWMRRLAANNTHSEMFRMDPSQPARLAFHDPEGHEVELMVSPAVDKPQVAEADDIPEGFRIRGIEGARSFAASEAQLAFAKVLGFRPEGDHLILEGATRSSRWYFSPVPDRPFVGMAVGVWHHIAFDAGEELPVWRAFANRGPTPFTQIFDHYFFDSAYSLSPGGVVELCSAGPGFTLDQAVEDLGEGAVSLSPWTEPLRERLEKQLTPIENPRSRRKGKAPKSAAAKNPRVQVVEGVGAQSA